VRGVHYDDSLEIAQPHGPLKPRLLTETQSMLYVQPMWQRIGFWVPLPRDSAGPFGSILVEESDPSILGGDVAEWERTFATIPNPRFEAEGTSYEFQDTLEDEEEVLRVVNLPAVTTTYLRYEYFLASDPRTIPILSGYRIGSTRRLIFQRGTYASDGGFVTADDSTLRRWRGNIWERITKLLREGGSKPRVYGGIAP
jgi:hypothetical protein